MTVLPTLVRVIHDPIFLNPKKIVLEDGKKLPDLLIQEENNHVKKLLEVKRQLT